MKNRPLGSVCLIITIFLCVVIFAGGAKVRAFLSPSLLEEKVTAGKKIQLEGQVYKKEQKEDYQILYLKNNSINYQKQSLKESRIIIYDNSKQDIAIGNSLQVSGNVKFYSLPRNAGNFNQKLYYEKSGIHGSVWADQIVVVDSDTDRLREWLYQFRNHWKEVLYESAGEENGATLSAMILGEKADMDSDVKELYQRGGIGHVIAISGLHLSFVGIGIYQLLRRLTGSYLAGGIVGMICMFLYVLMIGVTVSVVRAFVMFLFRVGADIVGRSYDSLTALSVAAVVALFWQPLCIYDGAFWLSFLAVLALVIVVPMMDGKKYLQGLKSTLGIQAVILPVQLYFFYEIPIYSPVLNLAVVPLMSVLLTLGMLGGLICMALPVLSGIISFPIFQLCSFILWLYEHLCKWMLMLPGARLIVGKPEIWQMIFYYMCLVVLVLWKYRYQMASEEDRKSLSDVNLHIIGSGEKGYKQRRGKRKGMIICAIWCVSVIVLMFHFGSNGKLQVTFLDVGQGDCIFMRGPSGKTYLMDGGSTDTKSVGKYRIEPYLRSQGVSALDYVFISHGDEDHINGVMEMLERQKLGVHIRTLVLPKQSVWDENLKILAAQATEHGTRVVSMNQGQVLSEGELKLLCLAPGQEYCGESGNAASMVLAVEYREFDMLLTGDVEGEGEKQLTENIEKYCMGRSFEVLKAAHHGSKNSSKEDFLLAVKPKMTIISAGIDNRYGHPHQETLDRLQEQGSKIYSTQENGAITVSVTEKSMNVKRYIRDGI